MSRRVAIRMTVAVLAVLMGVALFALGQDAKAELQKRFQARYPAVLALKDQGKIGETWQGWLEAVREEYGRAEEVRKILDEENADRAALYKMVAQENGVTPEVVGETNFNRRLKDARPGHWFKGKDQVWKQKE